MVVWRGARVVLNKEVEIADLIEDDRTVDDAGPVDLVELLNGVLFVEVEAEDGVQLLAIFADASDQQDLGRRDLHRNESSNRRGNEQVHLDEFPLADFKLLDRVQRASVSVVASEDEYGVIVEHTARSLRPLLVQFVLDVARRTGQR